jgi:hypothetical protein
MLTLSNILDITSEKDPARAGFFFIVIPLIWNCHKTLTHTHNMPAKRKGRKRSPSALEAVEPVDTEIIDLGNGMKLLRLNGLDPKTRARIEDLAEKNNLSVEEYVWKAIQDGMQADEEKPPQTPHETGQNLLAGQSGSKPRSLFHFFDLNNDLG